MNRQEKTPFYTKLLEYANSDVTSFDVPGHKLGNISNDMIKMNRASAYAKEVDPLMNEYLRKKTFDLFEDNEEQELLKLIELKVNRIKAMNPYIEE